jgi:aryl-alcohol dehydrogenase-like predicted oxidoreductase
LRYGRIPHLDKDISKIVCGTDFLLGQPEELSFAAYDAFWELGGRAFDSAHCYGENSTVFGKWIGAHGVASEVVFLDKGCHPYGSSRVTYSDMGTDIRENHERLGVSYTDLFVLHRDDENVPVGEIVDWLNDYQQQGLIGAFGGSNWRHERIAEANAYASTAGKQGFSLNNPNLTLAHNREPLWGGCLTIRKDGRAWHEATQFPLFSWSSMARGYFAGTDDPDVVRAYDDEISRGRRERARRMAEERGASTPQIAMAWVLNQPFPVFALAGLRTPEQVKDTLAALEIELTPAESDWLEHGEGGGS